VQWVRRIGLVRRPGELWYRVRNRISGARRRVVDGIMPSFGSPWAGGPMQRILPVSSLLMSEPPTFLRAIGQQYLEHRFDLLGSGWRQVSHDLASLGMDGVLFETQEVISVDPSGAWLDGRVNRANLNEAKRIWRLIDPNYVPIDWHRDFKSGYRWSASQWFRDVPISPARGVDAKVPWELARMQHLPQMAWLYSIEYGLLKNDLSREFRNQVLDFIATNPPRFGINWRCTMEVAIRAANWLVAHDMFLAFGASFDCGFERELVRSIAAHAVHIVENLEWSQGLRGNHYLSNIVGLIFAAAYLPSTGETDAWLSFAVQELISEVREQFSAEGSSCEASTSYHRLSLEMVSFATAVVLGLPDSRLSTAAKTSRATWFPPRRPTRDGELGHEGRLSPLPDWYVERLWRAGKFTSALTKSDGTVVQIGDNDSGRLLKLHPVYQRMTVGEARRLYRNLDPYPDLEGESEYWSENHLDHRHVLAVMHALFGDDFTEAAAEGSLDHKVVLGLCHGSRFSLPCREPARLAVMCEREHAAPEMPNKILVQAHRHVDLSTGLVSWAYPEFGVYILKSDNLFLSIRCGWFGHTGHAHYDQLSVELRICGDDVFVDPGTFVYTPMRECRDRYRSPLAHFAPAMPGSSTGSKHDTVFHLGSLISGECLLFTPEAFLGRVATDAGWLYLGVDLLPAGVRLATNGIWPEGNAKTPVCPGYGIQGR